ncbi:MAG: hypothetical protein ACYCXT_13595 [Acidiferrobacteraceae bacterium]
MELSKITIGAIFIFLPGILVLMVSERLTEHRKREGYEIAALTFVFGCLSHLLYYLLRYSIIRFANLPNDPWLSQITAENVTLPPTFVLIATSLLGVIVGFVVSYAANHSWLHRFAGLIGASRKFSDPDVWALLMNSKVMEVLQWVVVRDQKNNLMYQGRVTAFSTDEDPRELILEDVTVFDNITAEKMYDVKLVYLALQKKNARVEVH